MRIVFFVTQVMVLLLLAGTPAQSEKVTWSELPDPNAQVFDDPFRELDTQQLIDLRQIARLDARIKSAEVEGDLNRRLETQRRELIAKLANAGVDAPALLSRRWEIAEKRALSLKLVNPDVLGKVTTISGFAFPGPRTADGRQTAYLVPEIGMCSHYPPPPPNKLVRIILQDGNEISGFYRPFEISGRLQAVEDRTEVFVMDGLQILNSAVTLIAESVTPITPKLRSRVSQAQKNISR